MTSLTRSWYGSRAPLENMASVAGTSAEKVLDLKGAKHTAGEVHLDIQDHFYVIQNGALSDGDILIGPRIDGRRVVFRNVNLTNVTIRCTEELAVEVAFENCNEINGCRITADQITLTDCRVLENLTLEARELVMRDCWSLHAPERHVVPAAGTVRLDAAAANPRIKLRNIEFKGGGGHLSLSRVSMRQCFITGDYESVRLARADLHNCKLTAKTIRWEEDTVTHKADDRRKGNWAIEVQGSLKLNEVSFETLTVDSEVIANQAEDRSSVDIQNAYVDNEWESLRDNYSGTLLAFHLIFLLAFIAPLLSKVALAAGAAGLSGLALKIPFLHEQKYDQVPVWQILLFGFHAMDSLIGWWHCFLTIALLVYNIARLYLTISIVKLRSREEHLTIQHFRRARPAPGKYATKALVHRYIMKPLFVLALSSALWKLWDAIQMQIPVPVAG
ncbi:MAG: hypothetical protein KDB90_01725 [Planctomycetes bacterium]|nr:hypothetical protein [Planctomycetota bacterium]